MLSLSSGLSSRMTELPWEWRDFNPPPRILSFPFTSFQTQKSLKDLLYPLWSFVSFELSFNLVLRHLKVLNF